MVVMAREIGFCYGVQRAVSLCWKTIEKYGRCVSLGPIIHNERVNAQLEAAGLRVANLDEVGKEPVIIRSHGIHPTIRYQLTQRASILIDATCPFVAQVQKKVAGLHQNGYTVLIVGEPDHPEVAALAGFAEGRCYLCPVRGKKGKEIPSTFSLQKEKRLAVVSQTTNTPAEFRGAVLRLLKKALPLEMFILDTVCRVAERRQKEALNLAEVVDILLVVGSKKSANTKNLYRLLRRQKKETYLVSDHTEVQSVWCRPGYRIGLTSGTSTPIEVIKEVKQKIEESQKEGQGARKPQRTPCPNRRKDRIECPKR